MAVFTFYVNMFAGKFKLRILFMVKPETLPSLEFMAFCAVIRQRFLMHILVTGETPVRKTEKGLLVFMTFITLLLMVVLQFIARLAVVK